MIFRCVIFVSLFYALSFAKSYIISPLPLPSQEVLNVSTEKCSSSCLLNYFAKGEFFSFVAKFDAQTDNIELRSNFAIALDNLGIFDYALPSNIDGNAKLRLALLMPKKSIGRYSASSIDTILAYLMALGGDFVFEVFDSGDESYAALNSTYNKIVQNGFHFVIAILNPKGAQEMAKMSIRLPTFIPTINKKEINVAIPHNLIFGGIDYEAQIDALLSLAGSKNIVAYNDNSGRGQSLGEMLKNRSKRVIFEETIDSQSATTFAQKLYQHERVIKGNVIFFNTPTRKTGLIASQIALSEKKPDKMLSTQINFNPSLLLLVQKEDRKDFYVANVIHNKSQELVEYVALLGGDLRYDWVHYATAIGVEQLISAHIDSKRFFNESIKDSQVEYVNKIFKSEAKSFNEY